MNWWLLTLHEQDQLYIWRMYEWSARKARHEAGVKTGVDLLIEGMEQIGRAMETTVQAFADAIIAFGERSQ